MAEPAPTYDLLLLLSENATDEQRAKVLAEVEKAITGAGGEIERNDDWGRRPMAYQISHQREAEYHLLQFKAPGELIGELSHTLHITDGVLRFRVIKNRPGTPAAPSSPPPVVATAPPAAVSEPAASPAPAAEAAEAEPAAEPEAESGEAEAAQPEAEAPVSS
jgi:small subunit ribosomal protein S6